MTTHTAHGTDWADMADTLAALRRQWEQNGRRRGAQWQTGTVRHGGTVATVLARCWRHTKDSATWAAEDPAVTVVRTDDDGAVWVAWADTVRTVHTAPVVRHTVERRTVTVAAPDAATLADMAARVGGRLTAEQCHGLHTTAASHTVRLHNGGTVTVTGRRTAGAMPDGAVTDWAPHTWAGIPAPDKAPRPVVHTVTWSAPSTTERAALGIARRRTMAGRRIGRGTSGAMVRAGVRARRARSAALATVALGTGGTVTMGATLPAPVDTGDASADVAAERRAVATRKGWKAGTGGAKVRQAWDPRVMGDGTWKVRTGATVAETPDAGRCTVWAVTGWHVPAHVFHGAPRTVADMPTGAMPTWGTDWAHTAPTERGAVRHWAAPDAVRPPSVRQTSGVTFVRQTSRDGAPLTADGASVRRRAASAASAAKRSERAAAKRAAKVAARADALASLTALADSVRGGAKRAPRPVGTAAERRIVASMATDA